MPNKKYKTWKENPSEIIPRQTRQRWLSRNPQNGPVSEEMPTTSSKSKEPCKKKYKNWFQDSSVPVPKTTFQRWSNKCPEVNENISDVVEPDRNIFEENPLRNEHEFINDGNGIEDNTDDESDSEEDESEEKESEEHESEENESEEIESEENESEEDVSEDDESEEDESEADDSEENECNDNNEYESIDVASLYKNSTMSKNDAVVKIAELWMNNNMSKTYLKQHLKLLHEMLPMGNVLPKTPFKFFQYIQKQVPLVPIIHHFFCKNCLIYLSTNFQTCFTCGGNQILKFFELDFKEQIKQLFEVRNLSKRMQNVSENEEYIKDVTDGYEYKRVKNSYKKKPIDITLLLYTDGLSLVKSSKSHCWPLMFTIAEIPPTIRHLYLVTFGLWCEKEFKPDMNLFLQPFCAKIRECYEDGIEWTDPLSGVKNTSKITAPLFIADAPARAQLQNILNFNGTYGCNNCEIKTKRCKRSGGKKTVRIYPFKKVLPLRNKNAMKVQTGATNVDLKKGVKGLSVISLLPKIDISTCVVPEYMHSVLLGVVKHFIDIWINKQGPWQIKAHLENIDDFILNIKPINKFARFPRSLTHFRSFKATEFYNFLLYYSLPALKNYLPKMYFDHWTLLVSSVYDLLKEKIHVISDLENAEQSIAKFVAAIKGLYGEQEMSYNVHQLLHLGLAVRRWGPLWATSAFIFESQNGVLAKKVHGKNNLGQELMNNLQILQSVNTFKFIYTRKPEEVAEKKFKALSQVKPPILSCREQLIFSSLNLKVEDTLFFEKAEINNELYTTMLYKKIKTNTFTVIVRLKEAEECYGSIRFFFVNNQKPYFLFQKFDLDDKNYFLNSATKSIVEHILPIKESNIYSVIEIENISFIKHVIRVGSFICLRPNFYNVVV